MGKSVNKFFGFISRYRRHRFAAPLMLLSGLLLAGVGFTVAQAATEEVQVVLSSDKASLIKEGKEIFARGCSSCHGLNAEGAGAAPSLIGVGAASVDFQVATGRMPMADMSQQAMRKEPVYDERETAALAAYVASLAPGPAAVTNEELFWERDGNTADGGELFRTNCAMCHNLAGQGGALTQGKYAPTVMGVEPKHIYEAMVTGPQAMPVFANSVLTHEEKLSIIKWIKFVETEPSLGGAGLGRVGPVTEGAVAWILGLGILIGIAVWLTTKAR
jgi:ubiquinol-cytochrome c reductase cytochrome c subunit